MTATTVPLARQRLDEDRTDWVGYVFVAFFTIPFLLFNIAPIFFGAYVGFTKWGIFGKPKGVGLQNFLGAFKDEFVAIAFKNTVLYGLVIVPCVVVIGFSFALYVHQRWPLSTLARTLFFSPYVVSATVIGLVWVWMLDTQFGLINHYLGYLGIDNVPWLTSTSWSLIGVSIASVWWDLGLAFVLFLAALQDVPRDLYEAAEVDGASRWQRLWLVILPQLRPIISLVVTLQMISSLRIFSQVYVMTNGGPASSSSSVIFYMYNEAIQRQQFGYASAVAMLLFLMIIVVTVIHRFVIRER
jgi:multiple sugar transport system permease protein